MGWTFPSTTLALPHRCSHVVQHRPAAVHDCISWLVYDHPTNTTKQAALTATPRSQSRSRARSQSKSTPTCISSLSYGQPTNTSNTNSTVKFTINSTTQQCKHLQHKHPSSTYTTNTLAVQYYTSSQHLLIFVATINPSLVGTIAQTIHKTSR